jgi:hypothetical protein
MLDNVLLHTTFLPRRGGYCIERTSVHTESCTVRWKLIHEINTVNNIQVARATSTADIIIKRLKVICDNYEFDSQKRS